MRRRLFVDCDDTLVLWGESPWGHLYRGDEFEVNDKLIEAVERYMNSNPDVIMYVWSGGGRDYAAYWMRTLFSDDFISKQAPIALSKDTTLPEPGDLCVDDVDLKVKCRRMDPDEFVKEYGLDEHDDG